MLEIGKFLVGKRGFWIIFGSAFDENKVLEVVKFIKVLLAV